MKNTSKWKLSTRKFVEDSLYEYGLKCTSEHMCHSFILDPDDNSYINDKIFTKEELEEIRDYKKRELPEIPEDLINYIMKFSDNKIHELRHSLKNDNESISENYVRELHHDIDWQVCGESSSLASVLRKNLGRTVPGIKQLARSKMGQRADLVLHVSSDLEFDHLDIVHYLMVLQ
nr:9382_t:CDS:2 [Entrophospora candida]